MGRVQVLDDLLIDRIAAGEVVERPSSVVKELIENSLDAGATSVSVLLEAGGRRKIRVRDDGTGMTRDDAVLAFQRHATSKLSRAADLDAIATLGFRGEALPSIAAVSRFTLQTAPTDGEGTEVVVHGGRIQSVESRGLARGTTALVERLFYNTPARRKFLRSESTELSHAVRWITRYALAYPEVRFLLEHAGRRVLQTAPTEDRRRRLIEILGQDFVDRLVPFESVREGLRASGLAGRPVDALSRRDRQHVFVNGRAVQSRVLSHAVGEAFGNTMPRGRYPAMFLFVEMDPSGVDVNVHPQKTEVRFHRPGEVHDLVRDAIAACLGHSAVVPTLADLRPGTPAATLAGVARATRRYPELREPVPGPSPPASRPPQAGLLDDASPIAGFPEPAAARAQALAQFQESYIVAQDAEGLVLVDQHAAHERVIFERYRADAEENRVEVQQLLFPVTVELAPHERILIEEEAEEFRRLGFEVEPFGGDSVRVSAVPALAGEVEPEPLLRELLGEAAGAASAASRVDDLRRRLITSAACQAAIKVHHPLTRPAMQALLDDLFVTASPSTCPHGRPALFRLSLEEVERAFRRR